VGEKGRQRGFAWVRLPNEDFSAITCYGREKGRGRIVIIHIVAAEVGVTDSPQATARRRCSTIYVIPEIFKLIKEMERKKGRKRKSRPSRHYTWFETIIKLKAGERKKGTRPDYLRTQSKE